MVGQRVVTLGIDIGVVDFQRRYVRGSGAERQPTQEHAQFGAFLLRTFDHRH